MKRRSLLTALSFSAGASLLPRAVRALAQQPAATANLDLAHDADRPEFHFLPPRDWMNDPNGPIWWKGKYHLFYQLTPGSAVSGVKYWGHAVSTDMVRWQHQPIALSPTPGGADAGGCWSGSAVVLNGVPAFLYTAIQAPSSPEQATIHEGKTQLRETQMLAIAQDDELITWKKDPAPVVPAPPPGMAVTGFRDPCPWREADGWYLAVGSGLHGGGGRVLLYRSKDLRHWDYLHPLAEGLPGDPAATNPVAAGDMWECPDFFEVDGHHCLLYSCRGKSQWTTGRYDRKTHRYTALQHGVLDHGAYYAPKSFRAPDGRRILWGWITESRPRAEYAAAGWSGVMSLPRVLTVDADGHLKSHPAREVDSLHEPVETVEPDGNRPWKRPLSTLRAHLTLSFPGEAPQPVRIRLLHRNAPIWELELDTEKHEARCGQIRFPLPNSPDLDLYLDGSVVEVFLGGSQAITSRVYGLRPAETEIEVTGDKAHSWARILFWPMKPISPDRLTT